MHLLCWTDYITQIFLTNLLLNLLFNTVYRIKIKPLVVVRDASGCLGFLNILFTALTFQWHTKVPKHDDLHGKHYSLNHCIIFNNYLKLACSCSKLLHFWCKARKFKNLIRKGWVFVAFVSLCGKKGSRQKVSFSFPGTSSLSQQDKSRKG